MSCHLYGIKNCSTVRNAIAWCNAHGVAFAFHDLKKESVSRERLIAWCDQLGWKTLLNTRGLTYRKLSAEQQRIDSAQSAISLMLQLPTLIKRPIVQTSAGQLLVGFSPELYASFLGGDNAIAP
jgi:arsenate reductase